MTLNAIEIWNLNRFKGTYKHQKIKNENRKTEIEFFMSTVDEKSNMDSQGCYHEMQNGYLFRQMQQEKIQQGNL